MSSITKKIAFVLLFMTLAVFAKEEDELKERLFQPGKKQKEVLTKIKDLGREDLLPDVSNLLRAGNLDEETLGMVLELYMSYGQNLEHFLPTAMDDYEWVLKHSTYEPHLLAILKQILIKKDKRLFYSVVDLITCRSMRVREHAFRILDVFKDDRALPYILELGNSEKPLNKYYYLEALNYIHDERAALHVARLLNDPSPAIRSESIVVIEKLNLKDSMNNATQMAIVDTNYEVRKFAVVYIQRQKLKNKSHILQKSIRDKNPEVREATVDTMSSFKDPAFSRNLSDAMETESQSHLRLKMIEGLLSLNNHGGGNGLSVALKDDRSIEVRSRAAFAIGKLKALKVIPDLITSLNREKIVDVKIEAVRSLGVLKEKTAVTTILNRLEDRAESTVLKSEMLATLDLIDDPKVMPVIFDMLETENFAEIKSGMRNLLRTMLYRYHGSKLAKS
jgi:HEAT repeat protein